MGKRSISLEFSFLIIAIIIINSKKLGSVNKYNEGFNLFSITSWCIIEKNNKNLFLIYIF